MRLQHHGHPLDLLPDRAVFLPDQSVLVLADVHLGKAGAFRAHGLAIPDGDDERDLARLTALLTATGARELVIAGDLFHAPTPALPGLLERFTGWLESCPACVTLVTGNHDRRALRGASSLPFPQADVLDLGPFRIQHGPSIGLCSPTAGSSPGCGIELQKTSREKRHAKRAEKERNPEPRDESSAEASPHTKGTPLLLCGHLHPVIRLRDGRRTSLRSPCFWQAGAVLILPAFGTFTGGQIIHPGPTDRVFLPLESKVVEAPPSCWR